MIFRHRHLAARREQLCAHSARLRGELAADAGALGVRFQVADRLVAAARSDSGRLLLAGAALLVLFARPRRVLRLGLKALALWPIVVPLVPHVKKFFAERGGGETSA
jgi:hypothetical protein